jgi:hypothetical protein
VGKEEERSERDGDEEKREKKMKRNPAARDS